ncbi:hypothetical protein D6779_08650 [Candidatus Parcubacteria bacterium]|nr:MAG: hypothetical protein D6779_08650 [Candidatus Parcubacteria bacterium]
MARMDDTDRGEIRRRWEYYRPPAQQVDLLECSSFPIGAWLAGEPVMFSGPRSRGQRLFMRMLPGVFDVDFRRNPLDGWAWVELLSWLTQYTADVQSARARFRKKVKILKKQGKSVAYVFGTGPSLSQAMERDWSDGYRIVCNTIVRDPILWHHLNPDFIVAGDAIYHFGFTRFAQSFRRDLHQRLQESDALFVYPAMFDALVQREFSMVADQLIPVPIGWRRRVDIDLMRVFALPALGNVLGVLLLPLACTMTRRIGLWGFDGRRPGTRLFWENSPRHSYPEYIPDLQEAHPAFFAHYVPSSDPSRYVRKYHGKELDASLRLAEHRGWHFEMLHFSYTPVLQKRFKG